MTDTMDRIAAGLERAFVRHGFAEPNVETLRDSAGVSLRTLYKYTPSRDDMILSALDHRHRRYMAQIFGGLPEEKARVLPAIVDRIAGWMTNEASHGCLFHAAVAASPNDDRLRALLARHKSEAAACAADAAGLPDRKAEITLILDGLTQCWPLLGEDAVNAAKRLSGGLAETG